MITERQENILSFIIKEFLDSSEPVSSEFITKKYKMNVSPATVRNELQELTEIGYIMQPHTSAGRIPTDKAYKYYVNKIFSGDENYLPDFIFKEIKEAKEKIEKELNLTKKLLSSLGEMSDMLNSDAVEESSLFYVLKIIGSKNTYDKNIDVMKEILKELESF